MDGNEQFISTETLYASVVNLADKLKRMTEQCEKLFQLNSDLIAENNQLKALNNRLNTALDIAQTDLKLVRDANKSLVVAVTETVR